MFFMCIELLGFPTVLFGDHVHTLCGSVPPAFFILSGYLVMRRSEDRSQRIVRTIRRTAVTFGLLAAAYFVLNLLYCLLLGTNILAYFADGKLWLDFLLLNVWPFEIGSAIWYVQALLYAYVILYFLDKWKLLKFDWLIAAVLFLLNAATGEFSGLIGWNILGYTYLPGNFLTRALPYLLLGGFIHRHMKKLLNVRRQWYWCILIGGVLLTLIEKALLDPFVVPNYCDHLIGMSVIAFSVCMLAFKRKNRSGFEKALGLDRRYTNFIYYLCQPVGMGLTLLLSAAPHSDASIVDLLSEWTGVITFIFCFLLVVLFAYIDKTARSKNR